MRNTVLLSTVLAAIVLGQSGLAAVTSEIPAQNIKLAEGVTRASAYEPVTTKYIAAHATDILSDVSLSSKVTGHLDRGQEVVAKVKPKQWDWLLVEKDGVGIGYVSRGAVAPANLFKS